jgi:hypothetical protein
MVPLSSAEGHGTLWRVLEGGFSKRDHEFESALLQRRVSCELGPGSSVRREPGQLKQPFLWRKNISGVLKANTLVFWNIEKN